MAVQKSSGDKKEKNEKPEEVGRHLVGIKELPSEKEKPDETKKGDNLMKREIKTEEKKPNMEVKPKTDSKQAVENTDNKQQKVRDERAYTIKDVLLGIINIVTVALLVVMLLGLPEKAEKLKELRNEDARNDSSVTYEFPDIEASNSKAEELGSLFIDDTGIVEFVRMVEEIKAEERSVKKIYFTSQKVVADRTGNFGIPVIIQMRGNWEQIGIDMAKIQKLPYLFRAVNIDVEKSEEDGLIELDYGGFLYVANEQGKN